MTNDLTRAILSLKSPEEVRRFLRDLLTEKEIEEFEKRWLAAQLLDRGVSYSKIIDKTSLSSTTVARIAKWLKGDIGGYTLVIRRLSKNHHSGHSRDGNSL